MFCKRSKLLQGSQIGVRSVGEKDTESVCLSACSATNTLNIGGSIQCPILILTGCSIHCGWSSGSLGGEEQSVADVYFVC